MFGSLDLRPVGGYTPYLTRTRSDRCAYPPGNPRGQVRTTHNTYYVKLSIPWMRNRSPSRAALDP
jgi:hypothetical protein